MGYEHTQDGPMWLLVSIPLLLILAVIAAAGDGDAAALAIGAVTTLPIIAIVAIFSRLTVTVDGARTRLAFGWGWPRKHIDLAAVEDVEIVRSPWHWGWGIRKIPHGWMWNTWGRDGVELRLGEGRRFRIGTDDVDGLYAALLSRVGRG